MNEILTTLPIIAVGIIAVLTIATIVMPLYVIAMDHKLGKIQRSLAALEAIMRAKR